MAIVSTRTDWKVPTATGAYDGDGSGSDAWTNAGNIGAEDGAVASSALSQDGSQWLVGAGVFSVGDFDHPAPTVTGIEFRILRTFVSNGDVVDGGVAITLAGALSPDVKTEPLTWSPAADGFRFDNFGGDGDLWGFTAPTISQLVNANSGGQMWADTPEKNATTAQVDVYQMRVFYEYDDGQGSGNGEGESDGLVCRTQAVVRPLNAAFQPNALFDTSVKYTVELTTSASTGGDGRAEIQLWVGPNETDLFQVDSQYLAASLSAAALPITLAQAGTKALGILVPIGWWVEIRTVESADAGYAYQFGVEQELCMASSVETRASLTDFLGNRVI